MIIVRLMWWKPSETKACKSCSLTKYCEQHFLFKKKKILTGRLRQHQPKQDITSRQDKYNIFFAHIGVIRFKQGFYIMFLIWIKWTPRKNKSILTMDLKWAIYHIRFMYIILQIASIFVTSFYNIDLYFQTVFYFVFRNNKNILLYVHLKISFWTNTLFSISNKNFHPRY